MHWGFEMGRKSNKIKKPKIIPHREPSMRPSRSEEGLGREYGATEIKRLRDASMRGLRDAEWGTELGALYLEGKITAAMYGAGKWWREMAVKYQSAISAPWPVPQAVCLELGTRGTAPDPDSEEGSKRTARERNVVKDFEDAHKELVQLGMLIERHVRQLCEENQRPYGVVALALTRDGLQKLVEWRDRRLTNKVKCANGG
jgi:hypothetical protein